MKIMITGATGFIGRKVALLLAQNGHQVHALCRQEDHPFLIHHENITIFKGDILDKESIIRAMEGCANVFHTAAMAKMWCRKREAYYEVNVIGTRNILEIAQIMDIQKVIYTSTCGVLGPTIKLPMSENDPRIVGFAIDYERTKYLAELEVKSFVKLGMNIVTVSPSRVYGEGPVTDSNTVSKIIRGYLKGKWRLIPGKGEQVANYAYVDDVVKGHIAAMERGEVGENYILGGEDISFNVFFDLLREISGKHFTLVRVPQKIIKIYSQFQWLKTKLTGLPPAFLPEFANRLLYDQRYSSNKAAEKLGYKITPFRKGFENTIRYVQDNE